MSFWKSLTELATDVVEVATTPIKVAVDMAKTVTAPVAAAAKEIQKEVGEMADEGQEDLEE